MAVPLGSSSSGIDGSSEGGRINTIRVPGILALYGVSLIQHLRGRGFKGRVIAAPVQLPDGWALQLTFDHELVPSVPDRWNGHKVVVERLSSV